MDMSMLWIKCSDKMPSNEQRCLCYRLEKSFETSSYYAIIMDGIYYDEGFYSFWDYDVKQEYVTHWMPLVLPKN